MWSVLVFLKEIIALWCQLHKALYQENLKVHSWMIFCPDGIIPDSGLTRPNNTHTHTHVYIYIYIYYNTLVVTISLGGFVADQMQYNLESAQYLW